MRRLLQDISSNKWNLYAFLVPMLVAIQGLDVIYRQTGTVARLDLFVVVLLASLLITFLVVRLSLGLVQQNEKSPFVAFFLSLALFYYQSAEKTSDKLINLALRLVRTPMAIPSIIFPTIFIAGLLTLLIIVRKCNLNFFAANKYFTFFGIALLAIQIFSFSRRVVGRTSVALTGVPELPKNDSIRKAGYPDVYYIIVDAYTSSHSLEVLASYRNELDNHLKQNGFYVVAQGKSNYPVTYPSLASSLNLSYIEASGDRLGFQGQESLKKNIKENWLASFLKGYGYRQVYLSHVSNPNKEFQILKKPSIIFYTSIYQRAVFYPLIQSTIEKWSIDHYVKPADTILNPLSYSYYSYNNSVFTGLEKSISDQAKGPKFVYAHFMNTHAPFVSDSSGNYRNSYFFPPRISDYLVQIKDMNKKLVKLIGMLRADAHEKVIIIQADHGSHLFGIDEVFDIQNAYYFSDGDYTTLYPSISPVNTFRVVLNKYFNQHLKMLPDRKFYLSY